MKYREIVKLVEANGWFLVRQKGSHRQYHHPTKTATVTIAFHGANDDVPAFILKDILRKAEIAV